MTITVGERLPEATFVFKTPEGELGAVTAEAFARGRKVLMVGMPGAFTGTCSTAHLPSLIRNAEKLKAKGVDEVAVVVTNDVHVARAWAEQAGSDDAGIRMLSDPQGEYVKALGLSFDGPPAGLYARGMRHALVVEDGVVTAVQIEEGKGVCDMTGGEALLELV